MHRQLDDRALVTGQIAPEDVPALKEAGVTLIVNNRPDEGMPASPSDDLEAAAKAAGIDYRHVPIARSMGPSDMEAMREACMPWRWKLFAFCRWGQSFDPGLGHRQERGRRSDRGAASPGQAGFDLGPVAHLLKD